MKRTVLLFAVALTAFSASAQQPSTGFPIYGSFDSQGMAGVNLQNLNYHLSVPITESQGRKIPLNFGLSYDSSSWTLAFGAWTPRVDQLGNLTGGWDTLNVIGNLKYNVLHAHCPGDPVGLNLGATHYSNFTFVTPDGTVHPYNVTFQVAGDDCGTSSGTTTGYATDGSGLFLDGLALRVWNRSGIRVDTDEIEDPNGNFIQKTGNGSETDWHDSTGNVALKIINGGGSFTQYEYLDSSGVYETVTLTFISENIKTNFGCPGVVEYSGTAALPSTVHLPNGQNYTIQYEPTPGFSGFTTGRISSILLPSGGSITFSYTGSNDGISCSDGSTEGLTITTTDGSISSTKQYSRVQSGSNWLTTITYPKMPYDSASNQSVITFNSTGQETQRKMYQGSSSSGQLLRTVNSAWAANGTPASKTVILEDNQTESELETSFDTFGNLLGTKEHDWGTGAPGSILRTTSFTLLSTSAYINLHILDRVTDKTVADSTGTIHYREHTDYDVTSLAPCPLGVPGHDDSIGCGSNTRGNPTAVTTYANAAAPSGGVTRNFSYDIFGNLVQADMSCCQKKTWNYSATTKYAYPDSVVSGSSGGPQLTTSATYNLSSGTVATSTDENAKVTSYTYDVMNRPLTLKRPDSTQLTYTYDDAANSETLSEPILGTAAMQRKSVYDGLGRTTKVSTLDASGTSYSIVETQYDPLGRPYMVSNPHNSTAQYWTTTQFDALGRPTKVIAPDNSQTTYAYSENTVTVTDSAGKQRKSVSDGLGRITSVDEPDVTNGNSLTQVTSYVYSVLDDIQTATQGVQTRTSVYDDMGRLTSATTPESGTVSFQYNSFDLVTQRTDARGVITTYSYDGLNRLTQVTYNVGTTGVPATHSVTYAYGTNQAQFNDGRVITMTDGTGTESYTYDLLGRTTQIQKTIGGQTYQTNYAYNLASELTSITYPSGRVVEQSVDAIGRLCEVAAQTTGCASSPSPYATDFAYNPAFEITGFNYGNGVTAAFTYSPDRLQLAGLGYSKGAQTLFGLNYWYKQDSTNCPAGQTNDNGQIQCITDNVDSGRNVTYTYDALARLSTALTKGSTNYPKWGLSFTYDRYGNRTAQTVTAGSQVPSNSLSFANPGGAQTNHADNYGYDASGNMTNDGLNTLVYDGENRVTSSSGSNGSGAYSYDGNGLRVEKTSGSTTTVYIFSGAKVIAEYVNGASPTNPTREYVYAGGALLASISATTTTYYHQDHLSNRLVTDSTGAVAENLGAYPYGESWYNTSSEKWLFTSYERDAESGNDYAMARYDVNRLGRFASPDPVSGSAADPQSLNRYAYVRNDPINYTDPSGMLMIPGYGYMSWGNSGFGSNWNEFYFMENPVRIGTLYQFTGTFNYGNYNLQQLIGYANEGELNLTTSPIYGAFLILEEPTVIIDASLNIWARGKLINRLKGFANSNCAHVLSAIPGFTPSKFMDMIGNVNFYDGRSSSQDSTYTQNQVIGNGSNETLAQTVPFGQGIYAATISGPTGTAVVLGPMFGPPSSYSPGDTFFHEMLHAFSGLSDAQIANEFGISGVTPQDTSAITDWLNRDCK